MCNPLKKMINETLLLGYFKNFKLYFNLNLNLLDLLLNLKFNSTRAFGPTFKNDLMKVNRKKG
jgi:hypothetical protein